MSFKKKKWGFILPFMVGFSVNSLIQKLIQKYSPNYVIKHGMSLDFSDETINQLILRQQQYLYKRKPKRIILIRHGQSEAQLDSSLYTRMPSSQIPLTDKGKQQADEAGRRLKKLIGNESVMFYYSPFLRARQTFQEIVKYFERGNYTYHEDPRLREQEQGNFRSQDESALNKDKEGVQKLGGFMFRYKEGESGNDMYDRCTMVLNTMHRNMDDVTKQRYDNYVLVCHGLLMKIFIMRFFKWKYELFDKIQVPQNCEFWILEKEDMRYKLITDIKFIDGHTQQQLQQ